jgi:hypothetical protein
MGGGYQLPNQQQGGLPGRGQYTPTQGVGPDFRGGGDDAAKAKGGGGTLPSQPTTRGPAGAGYAGGPAYRGQ